MSSEEPPFLLSCLLFSTCDSVWSQMGYCDMKNLQRSLSKHELSTTHIQSQIALNFWDPGSTWHWLNSGDWTSASTMENREILKDLINATCFIAKQELAFRRNDQSTGSIATNLASPCCQIVNNLLCRIHVFVNLILMESAPHQPWTSPHVTESNQPKKLWTYGVLTVTDVWDRHHTICQQKKGSFKIERVWFSMC